MHGMASAFGILDLGIRRLLSPFFFVDFVLGLQYGVLGAKREGRDEEPGGYQGTISHALLASFAYQRRRSSSFRLRPRGKRRRERQKTLPGYAGGRASSASPTEREQGFLDGGLDGEADILIAH